MNSRALLESLTRDASYALRAMRKSPGFAAMAVLTLGLGIGANTGSFSVIEAVLLKPLDYRDADQLVTIAGGATPVRFEEMKAAAQSFAGMAAYTNQENLTLEGGVQPEVLKAARLSAGSLEILGVNPILGRGFLPAEDARGGPAAVILSTELWLRRFHGDLHMMGKTIDLAGAPFTVVGILPAQFRFPYRGLDVWLTQPAESPAFSPKSRSLSPFLTVFGRLKPGATMEAASAEMAVIHKQYAANHPAMLDAKLKSPVRVKPLKDQMVGNIRSELWVMFGAVGFVLLIACGNLASLLLARGITRSREFAIRIALGAARSRLIGQLLIESVLLSSIGGTLGVLLAFWSLAGIRHLAFELPRADEIHLDWRVLVFAAALSMVTGILFGLAPSLSASRPDLTAVLRTRTDDLNTRVHRTFGLGLSIRGMLVAGQIALSIILLIGAALLIESVIHLRTADPGFDAANLLTLRINLQPQRYDTDGKKTAFFEELLRKVGTIPGVESAAAAMTLPMTGFAGSPVQDAGKPPLRLNERPIETLLIVTPEYFKALRIPLKRGRYFTEQDRASAQRVAIIDEGLARLFWPAYPNGVDPVGHFLLIGGTDPKPAQIIGITGNVHQSVDNSGWPGSVYEAFAQNPVPSAMLAIRTEGEHTAITSAIREQVQALDGEQAIFDVQSMNDLVEAQLGRRHLMVMLLGVFAGMAAILSLVGVYGVISYYVTERTPELGIRRALGAQPVDILNLIVGQALGLALTGAVLGVGGAFALTRVLKAMLFQLSATDPSTFAGVTLLFVAVALGAGYLPARRAMRVDPMVALRYE